MRATTARSSRRVWIAMLRYRSALRRSKRGRGESSMLGLSSWRYSACQAPAVVADEPRPGVLGLADHEHVHLAAQLLRAQRREGAARQFPRRRKDSASSNIRRLWTTNPVIPITSASVSRSTGSTFSSQSTTSWGGGVSPATVGHARLGNTHRFPRLGSTRSKVQNDSGFFGAIK